MDNEKQIQIETVLKNIETDRLKYAKTLNEEIAAVNKQNSTKHGIKVILFLLVVMGSIFWLKYSPIFIIVFILLMVSGLLNDSVYTPPAWFVARYHRLVMEGLLGALYSHIRYEGKWASFRKEINDNLLLTGKLSGENHLSGTTKNGYEYDLSEIEEVIEGETQFKGIFLKLKSPAFFSKPIVILPKTDTVPDHLLNFKFLVIPDIDPVFSNRYSIFVENLDEKNVLTPAFLQPLIKLSKEYSQIRWSFVGNQIYFAAVTKRKIFNTLNIEYNVLVPRYLERFRVDAELCLEAAEAIGEQLDHASEKFNIEKIDLKMPKDNNDNIYDHLIGDNI